MRAPGIAKPLHHPVVVRLDAERYANIPGSPQGLPEGTSDGTRP